MLFKRRNPADFRERLRLALWPRRSFQRSARYFTKRVLRLRATPHAIAAGVAAGVFASFFPIGIHLVVALALAWLIAGNFVAAALGTAFGNPLTIPVMWGATYEVGFMLLHGGETGSIEPSHIGSLIDQMGIAALWEPLLEPMIVGAEGVFWRDMGVVNLPSGRPTMHLTGGAAAKLEQLVPPDHRAVIHLTITDEFPMAQAFVIIEALPYR